MQYPLEEKIGKPHLPVERKEEFSEFGRWIAGIPEKTSKSRVILARRKSGKTSFVQRLFNRLWSENGQVIPFYLDIGDSKVWYPNFAVRYFRAFASQFISFLERRMELVSQPLSLEEIRQYGKEHNIPPPLPERRFSVHRQGDGVLRFHVGNSHLGSPYICQSA